MGCRPLRKRLRSAPGQRERRLHCIPALVALLGIGVVARLAPDQVAKSLWLAHNMLGAALMVALVALSRVYLGAHFVSDVLAVGLALQRGPEFRRKMQNAQKALQEFEVQFDSFIG